jgi:hypothetical protein
MESSSPECPIDVFFIVPEVVGNFNAIAIFNLKN